MEILKHEGQPVTHEQLAKLNPESKPDKEEGQKAATSKKGKGK